MVYSTVFVMETSWNLFLRILWELWDLQFIALCISNCFLFWNLLCLAVEAGITASLRNLYNSDTVYQFSIQMLSGKISGCHHNSNVLEIRMLTLYLLWWSPVSSRSFCTKGRVSPVLKHWCQVMIRTVIKHCFVLSKCRANQIVFAIFCGKNIFMVCNDLNLQKWLKCIFLHASDIGPDELPASTHTTLQSPVCLCQSCRKPIFTEAYPMVFEGQVRIFSLYRLALCCSWRCVRLASLIVQLPLIHPNPSHLHMALALANWQTFWITSNVLLFT